MPRLAHSFLAGPLCTQILGDLGAEVIKIEDPRHGDDTRLWGPPFVKPTSSSDSPESAYFLSVNRNKQSLAVDLKQGRKLLLDLVGMCDVLVENFLPGKMESFGLGYDELRRLNNRLVYASISGYGPTGPYSQKPGYDAVIEAEAGLMHITGPVETPHKVGVAIVDITTGLYCHGAILAALYSREKTGQGQKIDLSLFECQIASLANVGSSYLVSGKEAVRHGNAHASIVPYGAFKASDGDFVISCGNNPQFQKLCDALDLPANVATKFETNQKRVEGRQELCALLNDKFSENTKLHWIEVIAKTGIPVGPVNNLAQAFQHPQIKSRNMVETVQHSTVGTIKVAGIPVKYSETPASISRAPPTLGEQTRELLRDLLGYSEEEIDILATQEIIR